MSAAGAKMLLSAQDVQHTLRRLAYEILEKNENPDRLCVVGLAGESCRAARHLHAELCAISGIGVPFAMLDLAAGALDGIDTPCGRDVVLAVDVLFSGESVRSAMGVLCAAGRPATIQLAALVDRGHRRYPIRANYVGKNIPTSAAEFIEVRLEDAPTDGVFIHSGEQNEHLNAFEDN